MSAPIEIYVGFYRNNPLWILLRGSDPSIDPEFSLEYWHCDYCDEEWLPTSIPTCTCETYPKRKE